MQQLINFINTFSEENTIVTYSDKYGKKQSTLRSLKEVVEYGNGSLVKNFSIISGRILAAGRLYKIIK